MAVALICCILALVSPVSSVRILLKQDTDTEISSLRNEVVQLKQAIGSLQTQSRTQDQKYAAILSSVLSSVTSLTNGNNSTNMELTVLENQLSSVTSTVGSIANDRNSTLLELDNVKNQLNTSVADLNVLKSQLSTMRNTSFNKSELPSLRTELGNLAVCFEAFLNPEFCTIKDMDKIIFDNVTLNIGQAFDQTSGVFTAPITGTYIFWAHILRKGSKQKSFYADIYSSKGRLTRGYAMVTHGVIYNAATPIVVAFLTKEEQVWFVADVGEPTATMVGHQGSSYGGTLLHMQ